MLSALRNLLIINHYICPLLYDVMAQFLRYHYPSSHCARVPYARVTLYPAGQAARCVAQGNGLRASRSLRPGEPRARIRATRFAPGAYTRHGCAGGWARARGRLRFVLG
jgi:hypothetical protein